MGDLIQYLQDHLAQQFLETVSVVMMPELSAWLRESWLDTSVPSSLDELNEYQKSIYYVHEFSRKLESLSWPGAVAFEDWCKETPKIWLNKRKEIELDWTRGQLSHGEHLPTSLVTAPSLMHPDVLRKDRKMLIRDFDRRWSPSTC